MHRNRIIAIGLGVGVLAVALTQAGPLMSKVEQPAYVVERADGALEVRRYPALTVAQVAIPGARKAAIGDGFRAIAHYIFGGNASREKVAMTAPVLQRHAPAGTDGGATGSGTGGPWTIQFVMPRAFSLATLPKPDDPRVTLATQPAATYAVIRFSGLAGNATIAAKTRDLTSYIATEHLSASGPPILAFFDPPWILPFLRRNEIMIEVRAA